MDAEWNKIPIRDDDGGDREILTRNFRASNILDAAQAMTIVAEVATEHSLGSQTSCSISGGENDCHITVILHTSELGSVPDTFFRMADAIDEKLAAPLDPLHQWKAR